MTSKILSYLGVAAVTLFAVLGVLRLLDARVSLHGDGDMFVADAANGLPSGVAEVADTANTLPRGNGSTAKYGSSGHDSASDLQKGDISNDTDVSTMTPLPPTPWPRTPTPEPSVFPVAAPTPSQSPPPPTPWPRTPTPTPEQTPVPTPEPTPEPSKPVRVVINEVAWMGTDASSADEWLELYNPGGEAVDLAGWSLSASDGSPDIALSGTVAAGGYFLLERTDDSTVADVPANIIYTGNLSNAGETLVLRDPGGSVVDTVGAGAWYNDDDDVARKQDIPSMERVSADGSGTDEGNWASNDGSVRVGADAAGNPIAGTPGYRNSVSP